MGPRCLLQSGRAALQRSKAGHLQRATCLAALEHRRLVCHVRPVGGSRCGAERVRPIGGLRVGSDRTPSRRGTSAVLTKNRPQCAEQPDSKILEMTFYHCASSGFVSSPPNLMDLDPRCDRDFTPHGPTKPLKPLWGFSRSPAHKNIHSHSPQYAPYTRMAHLLCPMFNGYEGCSLTWNYPGMP